DGTVVYLRKPHYLLSDWSAGELPPGTRISPRLAPPVRGMGLLDAIADSQIAALADANDRNGDGIRGRVNLISSGPGSPAAGRFGWQAEQWSLRQQTALALNLDIGIGNPLYPEPYGDCTQQQKDCLHFAHGNSRAHGDLEADQAVLELLLLYLRNSPVPASTPQDAEAAEGGTVFEEAGCHLCHHPQFSLADAVIAPYTDLLVHDMGPQLADFTLDGRVLKTRWRTPPLWNAGKTANTGRVYLHDGRARTLTEAILWHGGEAELAVNRFRSMTRSRREALITFLRSL
ncbi:MAG: di-heme oxidoredictase family protein, partial [Pseudohongiellaceae bacterium]